jgi:hypothetical protein
VRLTTATASGPVPDGGGPLARAIDGEADGALGSTAGMPLRRSWTGHGRPMRDAADYHHVFQPPSTPEESSWDAVDADLVAAIAAAKAAARPLFVLLTGRHLTAWGQRLAAQRGPPQPPIHPIAHPPDPCAPRPLG